SLSATTSQCKPSQPVAELVKSGRNSVDKALFCLIFTTIILIYVKISKEKLCGRHNAISQRNRRGKSQDSQASGFCADRIASPAGPRPGDIHS
ncbi:MAG: hypothetical protein Q9P14_05750, partial [candidate division KSB1 bacterium]|nr:hypothetical protein [candidate division KSB1 bacterium]